MIRIVVFLAAICSAIIANAQTQAGPDGLNSSTKVAINASIVRSPSYPPSATSVFVGADDLSCEAWFNAEKAVERFAVCYGHATSSDHGLSGEAGPYCGKSMTSKMRFELAVNSAAENWVFGFLTADDALAPGIKFRVVTNFPQFRKLVGAFCKAEPAYGFNGAARQAIWALRKATVNIK